MMMMMATTHRPRFGISPPPGLHHQPQIGTKCPFSFVMVFWVGLRQGVGSASISSLVRQLYQRKRCSELSGTVVVARQLDRITFDPRVLGSAFPKSFPCLSARAWSQAGTVQLDGCTPYPPCVFPLPPVWNWYTVRCTSCCFSQTPPATHRLLETAVPHVVSSQASLCNSAAVSSR